MRTNEDIEGYLIELSLPYEKLDEGLWMVNNEADHVDNILVNHSPPIITFVVKLMDVPSTHQPELFEQLLRLNGTEMVAGAYGIEEGNVVLVDTLQSENLDYNEFFASIESLSLAIRQHYSVLKKYRLGAASSESASNE